MSTQAPPALRRARVLRVSQPTPRLRRLILGLPEDGDAPPLPADRHDDHVRCRPASGGWERAFTVRRLDPVLGELEIDVVQHPGGAAADWAARARPGDELLVEPGARATPLPATGAEVLVGDETALPAIARRLADPPADRTVHAIVEVAGPAEEQPLRLAPGTAIAWVHRGEEPPGRGDRLLHAVEALPWPAGRVALWLGGEASLVERLRGTLQPRHDLPDAHVRVHVHWRRDPAVERRRDAQRRLGRLADLLGPWALRVAVTLDLVGAIDRAGAPRTSAELAADCAAHERTLRPLLRVLVDEDVLTAVDGPEERYAVGPIGEALRDPFARGHLHLDGADAAIDQAWAGLLETVRTGGAGFPAVHGGGFWEHLAAAPARKASFDRTLDGWAQRWAPAVAGSRAWPPGAHVVDVGGGRGRLLAAVLDAAPGTRGTLVEQPDEHAGEALADAIAAGRASVHAGSFFDPLPSGDLYLLAQVLHDWPDDRCAALLRRIAEAAPPDAELVVVERLVPDGPVDRRVAGMDLRMRVVFGGGERTRDELAGLLARGGFALDDVRDGGLGLSLLTARPAPAR